MSFRASNSGKGTKIHFSRRRNNAGSNSHGKLEAAKRNTQSFAVRINPSSWMRSSVFIHLEASWSPSDLVDMIESISSKNIVEGWWYQASSNRTQTNFSESPHHLLTIVDADMLKKVVLHSVATAFAIIVFPVPGGPNNKIPFHGSSKPVKY